MKLPSLACVVALCWASVNPKNTRTPPELPELDELRAAANAFADYFEGAVTTDSGWSAVLAWLDGVIAEHAKLENVHGLAHHYSLHLVILAQEMAWVDALICELRAGHEARLRRGRPVSLEGKLRMAMLVRLNDALVAYERSLNETLAYDRARHEGQYWGGKLAEGAGVDG